MRKRGKRERERQNGNENEGGTEGSEHDGPGRIGVGVVFPRQRGG